MLYETTMENKNHHTPSKAPRFEQASLFDTSDEAEHLSHVYHYELLNSPNLRTDYVRYTERLISQVTDDGTDTVVFLDKSARPVAWMMRELWPMLGIDQGGEPVDMPQIRFANIDREQWEAVVGRSEDKDIGIDMRRIHPDTVDSLRGLFAVRNMDHDEYAHDEPTQFDDKKVLVVDEVKSSGDTLVMADALFSMAFPEAEVKSAYWMPPVVKNSRTSRGGVRVNADLPIWYDKNSVEGRAVADRDKNSSLSSSSMRQRRGAMFLSARFNQVDQLGMQLRNEIHQLAKEVSDGIIPVVPDAQRSDKAFDVIMKNVNHLTTDELVKLRKESSASGEPFQKVYVEYKRDRSKAAHPSSSS